MRAPLKMIAMVLAAAFVTGVTTAPAAASFGPFGFGMFGYKPPVFGYKPFPHKFHIPHWKKYGHKPPSSSPTGGSKGSMTTGKIVVGCLFGSALGLIVAALAKKEKGELTQDEAYAIAFTCGLMTGPVIANFNRQD